MYLRMIAGALSLAPVAAFGQTTVGLPPIAAPATSNAILRTGTEVPLRLAEELTTAGKKLRVG
jgi:hypothetical protein